MPACKPLVSKELNVKGGYWPMTRMGKWAVGLAITFVLLIGAKIAGAMPLPTFSIAALGLAGFVLALAARFKKHDRAPSLLLPMVVGVVILLWTAAEVAFPH